MPSIYVPLTGIVVQYFLFFFGTYGYKNVEYIEGFWVFFVNIVYGGAQVFFA